MADNYLERRQEEYERRKAEWMKKKKHSVTRPKGQSGDLEKKQPPISV